MVSLRIDFAIWSNVNSANSQLPNELRPFLLSSIFCSLLIKRIQLTKIDDMYMQLMFKD